MSTVAATKPVNVPPAATVPPMIAPSTVPPLISAVVASIPVVVTSAGVAAPIAVPSIATVLISMPVTGFVPPGLSSVFTHLACA